MNENTDNKARLIEVKPCRQCGAKVKAEPGEFGGWIIFHECTAYGDTEAEVIEKWNRIESAGLLAAIPKDPPHDWDPQFNAWIDLDPEATTLEVLWAKKGWDAHKALLTGSVGVDMVDEIEKELDRFMDEPIVDDEVCIIQKETRKVLSYRFGKILSRIPTRSLEPKGRWISDELHEKVIDTYVAYAPSEQLWVIQELAALRTAPRAKEE